jgi:hypothetical protein
VAQQKEIERIKAMQPRRNWWEPKPPEPFVPLPGDPGPIAVIDENGIAKVIGVD